MRYLAWIPLLPAFGALLNGIVGIRYFGKRVSGLLAGALTVLNGRDAVALAAARATIVGEDARADVAVFDVTDRDAVRAEVAAIEARHRSIVILVNNAGIQRRHPVTDFPLEDWDAIVATNLTAPFLVSQAALPGMKARGRGVIINIASLMSELGRPTIAPYTAAKGGVRQLRRGLATELGPTGIRVNAIAPGYFVTERNRALIDNKDFDTWVRGRTPMRRWGDPDELAGIAVFLASDAASYITGQTIFVDGGMSICVWSGASRGDAPSGPPLRPPRSARPPQLA